MEDLWVQAARSQLEAKKADLLTRLERITSNVRQSLASDSEERAQQLENSEVVDALGNDARVEINKINAALQRINTGEYGICEDCDGPIGRERLRVHPYARKCIDCASLAEEMRARP